MSLLQDLRYALRMLAKSPGFAAVAMATLALGIGANTAVFSVVHAVVLKPLPFQEPDRLVVLTELNSKDGEEQDVSALTFQDWQRSQTLPAMAAWIHWGRILTGVGRPEELEVVRASPGIFELLGVRPLLGRGFREDERQPGRERVAVLSHGFWAMRFGADPSILGRRITLDAQPYTVVGVMPPGFRFPDDDAVAFWTPLAFAPHETHTRTARMFNVLGRLAPGVTLDEARAEMGTMARRIAIESPQTHRNWEIRVQPARRALIGSGRPYLILLGAVGFVLLIACTNVANLLLARFVDRQRETAVRAALGAGRLQLLRPLLLENGLVALGGGAAALLVASWAIDGIVLLDPGVLPHWNRVGIDGPVLAFTAGIALLAVVLCGLLPGFQASRVEPARALGEGRAVTAGHQPARFRDVLAVAQIALAFVLLVGAALLIHSLWRISRVEPGFRRDNVLVAWVSLPETKYPDDARQYAFFEALLGRLESLPGVVSAGGATTLPMNPEVGIDHDLPVQREGGPAPSFGEPSRVDFRIVTPGYFRLMGMAIRRGREFVARDRSDAPQVIVINETMARRFFPGEDPLGKILTLHRTRRHEIVGVVGDVRHRGLDSEPRPEMYVNYLQYPSYASMTVVVRTSGEPLAMAASVRQELSALDPDQPVSHVTTMRDLLSNSLDRRRFDMLLFGAFATVGLALAAIGVYGVVSFSVGRRTREIGIRMAIGGSRGDVLRMVLRQGLVLTATGLLIGAAAGLLATRLLSSMLFGVQAHDPATFAAVALLLMGVALLASYVPALRAARVDPIVALRQE